MARGKRPDTVRVVYEGVAYRLDLRRIRVAMVSLGVSLMELAEAADVSRSTLSRLLAGRRVSLGTLAATLEKLGLIVDDVLQELKDED